MATRYIKKYTDETAIHTAVDNQELLNPYVAYDESASTIDWNSYIYRDYSKEYLTIEFGTATSLAISPQGNFNLSYSLNYGNTWTDITTMSYTKIINGTGYEGQIILMKGINNSFNGKIVCDGTFNVYGNIMSLLYGDNFVNQTSLSYNYPFSNLFLNCTGLTDASNLILPATTLTYQCYYRMFEGCTNLTTAPVLPATTLVSQCYSRMFYNCTNLNYIKCLATDISATNCTEYWVLSVSSSGTFVKASGINWESGVNGIPANWTVEEV